MGKRTDPFGGPPQYRLPHWMQVLNVWVLALTSLFVTGVVLLMVVRVAGWDYGVMMLCSNALCVMTALQVYRAMQRRAEHALTRTSHD